jgi:hypothetical protein
MMRLPLIEEPLEHPDDRPAPSPGKRVEKPPPRTEKRPEKAPPEPETAAATDVKIDRVARNCQETEGEISRERQIGESL